jgi:MFS family permease
VRRNAVLFVAISLVSGFGSTAMSLVAGIWILDLTGSVSLAGLAGLCVYAPSLAAPWLGGLVDRLPRRPVVIVVDLALAAVLLTLLAVRSADRTWLIFVVLVVYGASYVLLDAGESALLPAALPPDALGDVNGWRSSAQEGMKLVAPLAGAGLYAWHGGGVVATVSATMPLLAAAMYGLLRLDPGAVTRPGAAGGRAGGVREALAVLRQRRAVRDPVLVAGVAIGMSGLTTASMYSRVTEGLDLPSTFLGVLASGQGVGSILAGVVAGRLIARSGTSAVAAIGAALFALACVTWCLPWWPAMIVGSVIGGVGLPWALIAAVTAVQTWTPDHLLGRVAATSTTVMFGPIALTNPLGAVVVHLGARLPLLAAAMCCLTAAVLVLRSGRHRTGPDAEPQHFAALR